MRYFSMFSGIGGFELGIKRAKDNQDSIRKASTRQNIQSKRGRTLSSGGESWKYRTPNEDWRCVGYSEIDKYAIKTYETHFPTHKNFGDATTINPEELPDFEMLCGGFPCQAFSIAGKRMGFEDTRGTLFFDIARIVKAKKPRILFLENVKGLLSHDNGRTLSCILATLDELGYNVEWEVLNSKYFGVPQNRERVFIIGHFRGTSSRQVFPIGQDDKKVDELQRQYTNTLTARYEKGQATGAYIIEGEQHKEIKQMNNPEHSQQRVSDPSDISPTIAAGNRGGGKSPSKIYDDQNKKWIKDDICGTIEGHSQSRSGFKVVVPGTLRTHNDSKGFRELKQDISPCIPARAREDGSGQPCVAVLTPDRPEKRQNGRRFKQDGDEMFTLTGQDKHGVSDGSRIRRLTPLECERLQGFPDNWTVGSDTQRYKQCGNAVTVNVIEAIAEKILAT